MRGKSRCRERNSESKRHDGNKRFHRGILLALTLPHGRSRREYLGVLGVSVRQNDWEPAAFLLAFPWQRIGSAIDPR
jgi:hypothetical protein